MKLDDSLPGAPHQKVEAALRAAITAGELQPGTKLPAQTELARQLGVAPMTLRKAIEALQADGLLRTAHGVGVFVTSPGHNVSELETLRSEVSGLRGRVERLEQLIQQHARAAEAE